MTDEEPTLTPAQEAEVRRLLAEARHAEPIPDDVADRMDRALAGLAPGSPAPVTGLASRRRRTALGLLAAAAAVVVVGVGLGQVLGTGGEPAGDSAVTADSPRDTGSAAQSSGSGDQSGAEPEAALPSAPTALADAPPVRIRPQHFAADVARTLGSLRGPQDRTYASDNLDAGGTFSCRAAAWGRGTFVPVRYDGRPGVLVFRRPTGDTRIADLYACGSAELLRTITLPAP